jgi:hypothetical protein
MAVNFLLSCRLRLGALIFEGPSFFRGLFGGSYAWVKIRNRSDILDSGPVGLGVTPRWNNTRELHFCKVFPIAGRLLLKQCERDAPFAFSDTQTNETPDVSFLIGHRGTDRLVNLLSVLRSIAGQSGVRTECVVCEQAASKFIERELPGWVRYVHDAVSSDTPFNRSRAFNVAARVARGKYLILHDNDLLIPSCYAQAHLKVLRSGWDVANLKRFIFYLDPCNSGSFNNLHVRQVIQNARGGGSLAISASAYRAVGGMDEMFSGWGGEDEEFWDRCSMVRVCNSQFLPLIHLWHTPQSGKRSNNGKGADTIHYFNSCMRVPAGERVERLIRTNPI